MASFDGCVRLLIVVCLFRTYSDGGSTPVNEDSSQLDRVISAMVGENTDQTAQDADLIKIRDPPTVIRQFDRILVEYKCQVPSKVGLVLVVSTPSAESDLWTILDTWHCDSNTETVMRLVVVHLPNKVAYRPSYFNKLTMVVEGASLRGWVVNRTQSSRTKCRLMSCYENAAAILNHPVACLPPYERPGIPVKQCLSWWMWLKFVALKQHYRPSCPLEQEVFHLIDYPLILSGTRHGLQTSLPEFNNAELQVEKKKRNVAPIFTIAVWLYIVEYCPLANLCSIVHRFTWEGYYRTPLIYINKEGYIHTQIVKTDGQFSAFLGVHKIPKHRWCQLVQAFNGTRWDITVSCEGIWQQAKTQHFWIPEEYGVIYDDTDGMIAIGGSEVARSFKGVIGDAVWYRRRIVQPHEVGMLHFYSEIPRPSADHPMYLVKFASRWHQCQCHLAWVQHEIDVAMARMQENERNRSCSNWFADVVRGPTSPSPTVRQCFSASWMVDRRRVIRKGLDLLVRQREPRIASYVSRIMYDDAEFIMQENAMTDMSVVVDLLKHSSCLGNHNATYMLSVIYNNGIGVKTDQTQARTWLWYCALEDHRLCHLSLGNKHTFGLDSIPQRLVHAYASYKNVADRTWDDRISHSDGDVYTEQIRLIDAAKVGSQTDEDGEIFRWLKHQAGLGVVSAQKNMGRMLYWGTHGIRRDVLAAVDYYRMGAEAGDLTSMHDYAIVLLKGHGVTKNVTKALELLERAADKGNVNSMNTLGWYAMDVEKNMTRAASYFEVAVQYKDPDAAHNLGHMHLSGIYPGQNASRTKAFVYFKIGATHGQLMSSLMVAMYNMRGLPNFERNLDYAVDWVRYVAEQNSFLGVVLRKALLAYRERNWATSLFYYLLAADAGVEVGNFNAAYLCEENEVEVKPRISRDCIWRFYNLSTKRHLNQVSPYAWIKMGDYYWYGLQGERNTTAAAEMYANAALGGDPHALYSLAYLVQAGTHVPPSVWQLLGLKDTVLESNSSILTELYSRCLNSKRFDAYAACTLSWLQVGFGEIWQQHQFVILMLVTLGVTTLIAITLMSLCHYLTRDHTVERRILSHSIS